MRVSDRDCGHHFQFTDTENYRGQKKFKIFHIHFIGLVFEYSGYLCLSGVHRQNKHKTITGNTKKYSFSDICGSV